MLRGVHSIPDSCCMQPEVNLIIRAMPQAGAAEVGKVVGKTSLVIATGMEGDYVR